MDNMIPYKGISPKVAKDVFIADSAQLIGQVTLGPESSVWFQCVLRGDINTITIGKRSNIQDLTAVHLSSDTCVTIGDYVTVGHNAVIHGCVIEDNVIIGMGACILDRAVIPKNSIVGANSLVTSGKTFPEGSLIVGSPAKAVRQLRPEEIQGITDNALHYVEYSKEYRN